MTDVNIKLVLAFLLGVSVVAVSIAAVWWAAASPAYYGGSATWSTMPGTGPMDTTGGMGPMDGRMCNMMQGGMMQGGMMGGMTNDDSGTTNYPSGDATEGNTVWIKNFAFFPDILIVKKGATVTWVNLDSVAHTVTFENSAIDSGILYQTQSFSYTFAEPGIYGYHCGPHPGMEGTIIVEE